MPAQRNLAHAKSFDSVIIIVVHVGNGNIGDSTVSIGGQVILGADGNPLHFQDSFTFDLGPANKLIGREISVNSTLSPNPAIPDNTLVLTYDLVNADFILDKSRTLTSSPQNGTDGFDISINLM